MAPGQTCRVYTNEDHLESCGFSFRHDQAIWGNAGDIVELVDPQGNVVDRGCWGKGCPNGTIPTVMAPVESGTATPGVLSIGRVNYDGDVYQVESDEWVEVVNVGGSAVDIAGWRIQDDDGNVFVFPAHIMQPGEACRVYTNEYHPETCGFSFGQGRAIWGNAGDVVLLLDPAGNVVDSKCWKSGCQ